MGYDPREERLLRTRPVASETIDTFKMTIAMDGKDRDIPQHMKTGGCNVVLTYHDLSGTAGEERTITGDGRIKER